MTALSRRQVVVGAASATSAGLLGGWAPHAIAQTSAKSRSAAVDPMAAKWVGFLTALGVPLLAADPVAWKNDVVAHLPATAARADAVARGVLGSTNRLAIGPGDAYGSARRLNVELKRNPALRQAVGDALSALVDPNGFVDTVALAGGGFPESPSQDLPRVPPYPLG